MSLPEFFAQVPTIRVRDPLAEILGATTDGTLTYRYADAVRLAGHSCPTVAGAFLMGRAALAALYPDTLAERGNIAVQMPARESDGTTGVVAQVLTLLTGAAGPGGFKGLGGQFARHDHLGFANNEGDTGAIGFSRLDNGTAVAVRYDPGSIPGDPAIRELIPAIMTGRATAEQRTAFGDAWQDRVRRILIEHADDPDVIQVSPVHSRHGAA